LSSYQLRVTFSGVPPVEPLATCQLGHEASLEGIDGDGRGAVDLLAGKLGQEPSDVPMGRRPYPASRAARSCRQR
jgi:hypothetical protein